MKNTFASLLLLAISFTSCKKDSTVKIDENTTDSTAVEVTMDEHNAMNSLDYQGTYIGNLPCADCEALETTILLTDDSFVKEVVYKGKSKEIFRESGSFEWNKEGNTITLMGIEKPNQYFVGENVLFHLDINGKRIEGDLASNYELRKKAQTAPVVASESKMSATNGDEKIVLKNSKWKLVKLYGKEISNTKKEKPMGITFTSDGRVSAFAGCNSMGGSYTLDESKNRIKFSKIMSTMMACEDMNTERELAKILEIADNYNFDGKTLKLNKARMATLAEFEIIK